MGFFVVLIKWVLIFFAFIIGMALLSEHGDKRRREKKKKMYEQEQAERTAAIEKIKNARITAYKETERKWPSHPLYSDVLDCVDQHISDVFSISHFPDDFGLQIWCGSDRVHHNPYPYHFPDIELTYASKGYQSLSIDMYIPLTMAVGKALEEKYKNHPDISIRTIAKLDEEYWEDLDAMICCTRKRPEPLKKVELG